MTAPPCPDSSSVRTTPPASSVAPSASSPVPLRNSRRAAASCASSATDTSALAVPPPSRALNDTVPTLPAGTGSAPSSGRQDTLTSALASVPDPPSSEAGPPEEEELPEGARLPLSSPGEGAPAPPSGADGCSAAPLLLSDDAGWPGWAAEEPPGPSSAKATACAGSMATHIATASTALRRRCFHPMRCFITVPPLGTVFYCGACSNMPSRTNLAFSNS